MTFPSPYSTCVLHPYILGLAFLVDLAIGDPRWLPHPVRLIGSAISATERMLRAFFKTPSREKLAGGLLVLFITIPAFLITALICGLPGMFSNPVAALFGTVALIYLTSTTIAVHELIGSARLVIRAVRGKSIEEARHKLSMLVGRDTNNLSYEDILRATTETLAENLSDGIIAPVFYLATGGLPLAMTYKAINTLDSMVGYKNDTYRYFGWAAARLDDIANYIPARITGLLIAVSVFFLALFTGSGNPIAATRSSLAVMARDGRKHTSPNSGIPEAAMAGALGIRMGGPSTYGGIPVNKPFIGDSKTGGSADNYLIASKDAISIVKITSLLGISIALLILSLRGPA
ncbi:MAG: adenosylcobinamide-phosphate synthase CbiB [Nitrospirae bacterium]|nr:adenosylcobinamide-phosphate synthase CbiB [Nitrospirota bacterium]MCL5238772.1 adenosylcobinamide-phosphate synthase CbiB [Nitrospirota bacterium]